VRIGDACLGDHEVAVDALDCRMMAVIRVHAAANIEIPFCSALLKATFSYSAMAGYERHGRIINSKPSRSSQPSCATGGIVRLRFCFDAAPQYLLTIDCPG
jgi:hypothetical protein